MARLIGFLSLGVAWLAGAAGAFAAQPVPWQMNFQPAATEKMEKIHAFHDLLLVIITGISLFVLVLLIWVMIRYNAAANPKPSKTTHNVALEVVWTVVPALILVFISFFSFPLLYYTDTSPKPDLTIKAIGQQWNWRYQYPDHGDFEFISNMLWEEGEKDAAPGATRQALRPGEPRRLAVDNYVVVPVGATVKVLVTAQDVLHSFTIPAFGFKIDAVPMRINETWFRAEREGLYYGQCSELCGAKHAFMPIAIEVVSREKFDAWVEKRRNGIDAPDAGSAVVAMTAPAAGED